MYNFRQLGKNVKIYDSAKIARPEVIEIGDNSEIGDFVFIFGGKGIKIGRYVHISRFVSIIGMGELIMGDYTVLADGARVLTSTDSYYGGTRMSSTLPLEQRNIKISQVHIKKDAFIGTNAVVHPGVTIGEGAIIGSCSLVLKDIRPWTINVGIPTREVGKRPKVELEDL